MNMIIEAEKNPWYWQRVPPPTKTTVFLLPILNMEETILENAGFINAYLQYPEGELTAERNVIYLLFKINKIESFNRVLNKVQKDILQEWDEDGGHVIVAIALPDEFNDDYELFLNGQYSKFSSKLKDAYKKHCTITLQNTKEKKIFTTYQREVVFKGANLKAIIEKRFDIDIDQFPEAFKEYCTPPDIEKESLSLDYIHRLQEKEKQTINKGL